MWTTHLESDILECEIKWVLGSITSNKASGSDGIQVELFQILKGDAVLSVAGNMTAHLENSAVATGLEKASFYSNPKEGQSQRKLTALCLVVQLCLTLCNPTRLLCPGGFPRQAYWSGLPCPSPGDLPNPGIKARYPTLYSLSYQESQRMFKLWYSCHHFRC